MDHRTPAVRIDALSFSYGETPIIREISLAVDRGEFVTLLGPNGAGKTTLLNLISGLHAPGRGKVEIFGRRTDALSQRERARLVGIVPQESTSNFNFTNLEIVLMGRVVNTGRFANEDEDDIREAIGAMERTRTAHLARRGFMEISGGEKQRVVIAQVLAQDASILLLDEPTSNLDINYQIEIMQLIRQVKRQRGLTVVSVFHDMNLAAQFADRIVFMKEGRVVSDGPPDTVLTPETIHWVYDARVLVERDPCSGKPLVVPLYHYREREEPQERGLRAK
jgi:iron complex transport system ATP-binding protein